MKFTKHTYKVAIRRARKDVLSRADILQLAKEGTYENQTLMVVEARKEYFDALNRLDALISRFYREVLQREVH